MMLSKLTWRTL